MNAIKAAATMLACLALLAASALQSYRIDLGRYFSSASAEANSRATLVADVHTFVASPTPTTAFEMLAWLQRYDALLESIERHDIYVYLRAEEDDRDHADATADADFGNLEESLTSRMVRAAQQLGSTGIRRLTRAPGLAPYAYLLESSLAIARHRVGPIQQRTVELSVTPVLDAAATTYKALRKQPGTLASREDAYASLLITIATANTGLARLRGFSNAAEASYFDKSIDTKSVERILTILRGSNAYSDYRRVADAMPKPMATPQPKPITDGISTILAAERPMGTEYSQAYGDLLRRDAHRLEICTDAACDDTGFSVGFAGSESGVYYGSYNGTTNSVRALTHESGHAVHRQFMNLGQPIAAYSRGPAFMFESFAIFNELLLLDHLYQTAHNDSERAFYLNAFLDDASFQVFGSAKEVDLESSIYSGIKDGSIKTATDLDALTTRIFARYDPTSAGDPDTAHYWAHDRLYYTDPLYDVNYLYAGLLALRYFTDFQRAPAAFSPRYVALLKNGFNAAPAELLRRFLGINLNGESALIANANDLIESRVKLLK